MRASTFEIMQTIVKKASLFLYYKFKLYNSNKNKIIKSEGVQKVRMVSKEVILK